MTLVTRLAGCACTPSPLVSSVNDDVSWLHELQQLVDGGVNRRTSLDQHDHTPARGGGGNGRQGQGAGVCKQAQRQQAQYLQEPLAWAAACLPCLCAHLAQHKGWPSTRPAVAVVLPMFLYMLFKLYVQCPPTLTAEQVVQLRVLAPPGLLQGHHKVLHLPVAMQLVTQACSNTMTATKPQQILSCVSSAAESLCTPKEATKSLLQVWHVHWAQLDQPAVLLTPARPGATAASKSGCG